MKNISKKINVVETQDILTWIPNDLREGDGRNIALIRAGGWMQSAGFDDDVIERQLRNKNALFAEPMDRAEIDGVVKQTLKFKKGPKRERVEITGPQFENAVKLLGTSILMHKVSHGQVVGVVVADDEGNTQLIEAREFLGAIFDKFVEVQEQSLGCHKSTALRTTLDMASSISERVLGETFEYGYDDDELDLSMFGVVGGAK